MTVNLETMKVNVTTVVSIVVSCFVLYFFVSDLIADAVIEGKKYTIDLDMERDLDVVKMYEFQIAAGIAKPDAQSRIASLRAKIARRAQEKKDLLL